MNIDAESCVRLVPIFADLPETVVSEVAALIEVQQFAAGKTLFKEGTAATAQYIIVTGQVSVGYVNADGRDKLQRVLTAGDSTGTEALFTDTEYTNTAITLVPSTACVIRRNDFRALLKRTPELALIMVDALGQQLIQLTAHATVVATTTVGSRLADYLVETAASYGSNTFNLPLRKKDLASYLGTTPETLSRRFKRLTTAGLIRQSRSGHVEIRDAEGLSNYAE